MKKITDYGKDKKISMLPENPDILVSVINTKLRDEYDSLEALCENMDIDMEELIKKLKEAGYTYNKETRAF